MAALRDRWGFPFSPSSRSVVDNAVTTLRAKLDPTLFDSLWSEGAALTLEAALHLALQATAAS